jgi:hypothetical protein
LKPRPTRQYLPTNTYHAIPPSQHLLGNTFQPTPIRQYLPANTYQAVSSRQYLEAKTYYKTSVLKSEPRYSVLTNLCYQSDDKTVIYRRKPTRLMAWKEDLGIEIE